MEQIGLELATRDSQAFASMAADHADRVSPGWSIEAALLFVDYGLMVAKGGTFLTEQAVAYAHRRGLPAPPDGRAWGAVVMGLKRRGKIQGNGYAPAHDGSPKTLWSVKG